MKKKSENFKLGFTLLELLVVVLIIGILAAIALPQYKLAVGKTKFATLKNYTKSLSESVNRYYITHDTYPENYKDLDLNFSVYIDTSTHKFHPKGFSHCDFWTDHNQMAACFKNISGKLMGYYVSYRDNGPKSCYTASTDETHVTNKICQQETQKKNGICNYGPYCVYDY